MEFIDAASSARRLRMGPSGILDAAKHGGDGADQRITVLDVVMFLQTSLKDLIDGSGERMRLGENALVICHTREDGRDALDSTSGNDVLPQGVGDGQLFDIWRCDLLYRGIDHNWIEGGVGA